MTALSHKRPIRANDDIELLEPSKKRRISDDDGVIDLTVDDSDEETGAPIMLEEEDEDEEMKDILAQIAAQEESERLAKQLQAQEAGASSSSSRIGIGGLSVDSDEEMARRLAAEWAEEDRKAEAEAEAEVREVEGDKVEHNDKEVHSGEVGDSVEFGHPPDHELRPQDPLFTGERPCTKCGTMVPSRRGHVVLFKEGDGPIPPSLSHLLHAPCSSCKTNHCRGCFKAVSCTPNCKGAPTNGKSKNKASVCQVTSCCAEGRAIAIFECLGGFDWQYLGEQETSATRVQKATQGRSSSSSSVGPGGTGYSTGGDYHYHHHHRGSTKSSRGRGSRTRSTEKNTEALSEHWDQIVTRTFRILVELLPRQYADDAEVFDMLPHSSIGNLIALSCVPEYLASLLRNDSVSDWIKRSDVYHAMLALLRRLAECELTVQVLLKPRFEQEKPPGITKWMWGDAEIAWSRDPGGHPEMNPPLFDYFRKLTKQCESFLAGACQADLVEAGDAGDEDTIKAASLCGEIMAVRDDLVRAMGVLGIASDGGWKAGGKGKEKARAVEEEYRSACERLAFKHVEFVAFAGGDGRLSNILSYAKDLLGSAMSTRVPKDRFHLIKELATMATSLPEGIFVRVDETRNDAIKAMIAGPPSTPYAGGLFEFDIFLPMTYPNTPPLVTLKTTGGGSVRFNPNLYNCGKVCLSLLGTWSGSADEQWKPGKSTLLQVLISIQSMILVEAPYFNEPGYGQVNLKNRESIQYNLNIQAQTTRWAIVEWMKNQHKAGMWAEVIAAHFLVKKDEIRNQLNEWHTKNPSIQNYSASSVMSLPSISSVWGSMWSDDDIPGDEMGMGMGMGKGKGKGAMLSNIQNSSSNRTKTPSTGGGGGVNLLQQFEDGLKTIEGWGLHY